MTSSCPPTQGKMATGEITRASNTWLLRAVNIIIAPHPLTVSGTTIRPPGRIASSQASASRLTPAFT